MNIKIRFSRRESFDIKLNDINTVKELIEKIAEYKTVEKYHFCVHPIKMTLHGQVMMCDDKLSYHGIKECAYIYVMRRSKGGGYIDNLKEESKSQIAKKKLWFDMNLNGM